MLEQIRIETMADSLEVSLNRKITKKGSFDSILNNNNLFRAGVTNDVLKRLGEHKVVDGLLRSSIDTSSVKDALALEAELKERGYDIGTGQHAGDNSTKVYIYEKKPGVTEE